MVNFNSIHFLIFFPVVVILYYLLKHKHRWILLLIASYYFYMTWKPEFIILIIISTLTDYIAGIKIYEATSKFRKKIFLFLSLFINLGLLGLFKYFNFFNNSIGDFLHLIGINFHPISLDLILPIGISFYTFQTLSYTIDIYRGKIKPEKHLGVFAVYVSFFPQLVAGPIERAKNLLPQFFERIPFSYVRITNGLKLMLWGFFKKIVIADRLALLVNTVYAFPSDFGGLQLIIATVFFGFQIYCDFSGYTDIAIGGAQVLGIKLMDNFKRPYFSKSIREFWRKWHISLTTWFKDYLYIPLGGNRVSMPKWYFNILIVFVISGLWHGANWTFILWGFFHGFLLLYEITTKNFRKKFTEIIGLTKFPLIHKIFKIFITFCLVTLGWVFFRAQNIQDAFYIISHSFSDWNFNIFSKNIGLNKIEFLIAIISIFFMEFVHFIQEHKSIRQFMYEKPLLIRWTVYLIIIWGILLFGVFSTTDFIYFQF